MTSLGHNNKKNFSFVEQNDFLNINFDNLYLTIKLVCNLSHFLAIPALIQATLEALYEKYPYHQEIDPKDILTKDRIYNGVHNSDE